MTDAINHDPAVQDHVRVEAVVLGRPLIFRTVIVKVCPTELWLGLASPDRRLETLAVDGAVRLAVTRPGNAMLGTSSFLRPLGGSRSRVFAVARPPAFDQVQRRAHVRYDIDLPLTFRHLDSATREPRGRSVAGVTSNIGPGGLLFQKQEPVAVGEELDITFPLSAFDRVRTAGVVTRFRQGGEPAPSVEPWRTGTDVCEIAVRFTRITSVDQDHIVRFILATEHRRSQAAARMI